MSAAREYLADDLYVSAVERTSPEAPLTVTVGRDDGDVLVLDAITCYRLIHCLQGRLPLLEAEAMLAGHPELLPIQPRTT